MACKTKKYKSGGFLDDLGLFGDIVKTYGNVTMGALGVDPKFDVDSQFLEDFGSIGNKVYGAAIPAIANIAAPGSGALIGAGQGLVGGMVNEEKSSQPSKQLDIDPRFMKLAEGGAIPSIIENPTTMGTDTMPVDSNGSPTSVSGNKGVALTDSGEVVWNGYVFSQDLGYAKKAKSILNKYKFRLGEDYNNDDPLSLEQMNKELADLSDMQENERDEKGIEDSFVGYADGGKINIKPSKRGTFTEAAQRHGMDVQGFANKVLANKDKYSSAMVEKANFARNASNWSENALGGTIEAQLKAAQLASQIGTGIAGTNFSAGGVDPNANSFMTKIGGAASDIYNDPISLGALTQIGTVGLRAANLAKAGRSPEVPYSYTPEKVDLSGQRTEARSQRDTSAAALKGASRNDRAAQIAAVTGLDQALSASLADSYATEQAQNVNSINRSREFNVRGRQMASEQKEQSDAAAINAMDSLIATLGGIGTGVQKDRQLERNQEIILKNLSDAYGNYTIDDLLKVYLRKGTKDGE